MESAQVLRGTGGGPANGWDYVTMDAAGRRVFLGRRAAGVTVINADTRRVVGQIDAARGANGVALATDVGRGYTSNGPTNDSTIFDLRTLRPIGRVAVGHGPDAIMYDPATHRVFTVNGDGGDITVIDAANGTVVGSVPLGSDKPEFPAVDGQGRAFINLQDKNQIAVVDLRALRVAATWPTPNCQQPTSSAFDQGHLLIGCRGSAPILLVIDPADGHVISSIPIGRGVDAIAVNHAENLIVTSNGVDASLSVIRYGTGLNDLQLVETVGTRPMARTMAMDPTNGRIFLVAGEYIQPAAPPGGRLPPYMIRSNTYTVMTFTRGPFN
jgi:DNA-binding beta-propeller fold protein YncE